MDIPARLRDALHAAVAEHAKDVAGEILQANGCDLMFRQLAGETIDVAEVVRKHTEDPNA